MLQTVQHNHLSLSLSPDTFTLQCDLHRKPQQSSSVFVRFSQNPKWCIFKRLSNFYSIFYFLFVRPCCKGVMQSIWISQLNRRFKLCTEKMLKQANGRLQRVKEGMKSLAQHRHAILSLMCHFRHNEHHSTVYMSIQNHVSLLWGCSGINIRFSVIHHKSTALCLSAHTRLTHFHRSCSTKILKFFITQELTKLSSFLRESEEFLHVQQGSRLCWLMFSALVKFYR